MDCEHLNYIELIGVYDVDDIYPENEKYDTNTVDTTINKYLTYNLHWYLLYVSKI